MDFKHLVNDTVDQKFVFNYFILPSQVFIGLMLSVVLMVTRCCDASFRGGFTNVIVHVPVEQQTSTHTHTIYRNIHHHPEVKNVEKPKTKEEKKVVEGIKVEKVTNVEETHGSIKSHTVEETSVKAKYDRPDFHMVAGAYVEPMKNEHDKTWHIFVTKI